MLKRGTGVLLVLLAGFFSTTIAHAQFDLGSFSGSLAPLPSFGDSIPGQPGIFTTKALVATPRYPAPNEAFEVQVSTPDDSFSGASIRWFVDGTEDVLARNKREHTLTAGALGESMNISVVLDKQNGQSETLELDIIPIQIDIVLESFATVPDFYAGRAVPSHNTVARAVATITTGEALDRNNLTYRWTLNSNVLEIGAIRGLEAVTFDVPLGQESYLDVEISDQNGVLGKQGMYFRPTQPEIIFYEENDLYGIDPIALGDQSTIFGNRITVRGEPYYMPADFAKPENLVEWSLAGRTIDTSTQPERNVVSLQGSGGQSEGSIALRLADLTKLSLPISNSVYIRFGF